MGAPEDNECGFVFGVLFKPQTPTAHMCVPPACKVQRVDKSSLESLRGRECNGLITELTYIKKLENNKKKK